MKTTLVIGYATHFSKDFQTAFNQELLATVGLSAEKKEVIIIPYENDGSLSLTETYNDLWECATMFNNAVFAFIHHDIHFKTKDWGKTLLELFNHHAVDIVGVAGADALYEHGVWWLDDKGEAEAKHTWGKVWHTHKLGSLFADYSYHKSCQLLQPVVVVDGLFIVFNPDTCLNFDEDIEHFHFYDISFCVKNFLAGKKIAVTESIQVQHDSTGNLNDTWDAKRAKFCEKYFEHLPLTIHNTF